MDLVPPLSIKPAGHSALGTSERNAFRDFTTAARSLVGKSSFLICLDHLEINHVSTADSL